MPSVCVCVLHAEPKLVQLRATLIPASCAPGRQICLTFKDPSVAQLSRIQLA